MDGQKKKVVVTAIAAFIVGFGISWILFSVPVSAPSNNQATQNTMVSDLSSATSSVASAEGKGSISVVDQPAGKTAAIKSVTFASPGWVVIREDHNGEPGNILGAQWLTSGTFDDQFVELLRGMVSGGKYYAVLYNDDGDKLFDYKKDSPLRDDHGSIIMETFKAR